ncbi:MAG TPA: hypothetical protein VFI98_10080 [Pseudolabrys sp.]|nr:hypothetical protein [Pseudolabrys sp.]
MVQHPNQNMKAASSSRDSFDLDALLHPAKAYGHPMDVVRDEDLTLNEKRAILASWASDACAVEAAPELRSPPSASVVRFDDIMEALKTLDGQHATNPRYQKLISRARRIKDLYRGARRPSFA